jgi:sortase (surface protein transpeptidase)
MFPLRRSIALALISVGTGCLLWFGLQLAQQETFQRQQSAALNCIAGPDNASPNLAPPEASQPASTPTPDVDLIGRLEIPRVHLSVMVMEGDDEATLKKPSAICRIQ